MSRKGDAIRFVNQQSGNMSKFYEDKERDRAERIKGVSFSKVDPTKSVLPTINSQVEPQKENNVANEQPRDDCCKPPKEEVRTLEKPAQSEPKSEQKSKEIIKLSLVEELLTNVVTLTDQVKQANEKYNELSAEIKTLKETQKKEDGLSNLIKFIQRFNELDPIKLDQLLK